MCQVISEILRLLKISHAKIAEKNWDKYYYNFFSENQVKLLGEYYSLTKTDSH